MVHMHLVENIMCNHVSDFIFTFWFPSAQHNQQGEGLIEVV